MTTRALPSEPPVIRPTFPLLAAALLAGCGAAKACPELPRVAAPTGLATATPVAPPPRDASRLAVGLTPDPAAMALEVTLDLPPSGVETELFVEAGQLADLSRVTGHDEEGELPITSEARGEGVALRLSRAPKGSLHVAYRVAAHVPALGADSGVEMDGETLRAPGRAALALPSLLEHRATRVDLTFHPYGDARGASSFGYGANRSFVATGALLRDALYVTGRNGEARFDTPEGYDEAAWTGYTAFDPRPIAADVAAFRTAARDALKEKTPEAAMLLIVPDARARGHFVASRRATAVVVELGLTEPWSGPVRIAVGTEVLKRWIGGEVWLGPRDAAHEALGLWFAEGVSRALARSMLFRFGVITPAEMLDEMHGLEAVVHTSRFSALGHAELAARHREAGATPLLVARGALYATRVEALLRKKSGGKTGLEEVIRSLIDRSRHESGNLPASAFLDAMKRELGDAEAASFASAIDRGVALDLPAGALGPCFSSSKRRYAAYELGFDLGATRKGESRRIVGLDPKGAAARAGLAEGDVLVDALLAGERADQRVTIVVDRAGARRKIEYLPAGASMTGEGWTRKRDVPDEACAH